MEGGNNRNIFPSSNPFNSTLLTLGSGQGIRPPPANLLNQGYAKEVASIFQNQRQQQNKSQHNMGGFFSQNRSNQTAPVQPIIRKTNLFIDQHSPWKQASQQVKQLFSDRSVTDNLFHFPQKIENICILPQNQSNIGETNYDMCTKSNNAIYYACRTCPRTQFQAEDIYNRNSKKYFIICEGCFEPEQHIDHFYERKVQNPRYMNSMDIYGQQRDGKHCICGKDIFKGNQPIYQCKNHKKPEESQNNKQIKEQWFKKYMKNIQMLFQITFYLQRQMYSFDKLQEHTVESYFKHFTNIIRHINETLQKYSSAYLIKRLTKLLLTKTYLMIADQWQSQLRNYSNQIRGRPQYYQQKTYKTQLIRYFIICMQKQQNTLNLLLKLIGNRQFRLQLCKYVIDFNKQQQNAGNDNNNRNKQHWKIYLRGGLSNQLQLNSECVKLYLDNEHFYFLDNQMKIFWMMDEQNYNYAVRYVQYMKNAQNVYSRFSNHLDTYLSNMENIINQFLNVPVSKFLQSFAHCILPVLLNCYRRVYINREIQDQDQEQEEDTRNRVKKWESIEDNVIGIINNIVISLGEGDAQKIGDIRNQLSEMEKKYIQQHREEEKQVQKQPEQQVNQYVRNMRIQQQRHKTQLKAQKNILTNFEQFCSNICKKYPNSLSQYVSDNANENNFNMNNRDKKEKNFKQYDKEQQLKQKINIIKLNSLLYNNKIVTSLDRQQISAAIQKTTNRLFYGSSAHNFYGNRLNNKKYSINERNRQSNRGYQKIPYIKYKNIQIYEIIKLVLFYQFLLPQQYGIGFSDQQKQKIVYNIFFYKQKITSQKLRILKKLTKLPNFNQLVQQNLVYNLQTKSFFYNENADSKKIQKQLINPIYQLLCEPMIITQPIGIQSQKELKQLIKTNIQRQILNTVLIQSKFIKTQKQKINGLIQQYGNDDKQSQYVMEEYVLYISWLIIGNIVSEGKCQIVCRELERLRSSQQERFGNWVGEEDRNTIDKMLFGEIKSKLDRKELQKQEIVNVQVQKLSQNQQQIKQQAKIDKKQLKKTDPRWNKIQQKKSQVLKKQGTLLYQTEHNSQLCMICHEKQQINNQLVYLMKVNVNKTVALSFFKGIDKMGTHIKICFHQLHLNCYLKNKCAKCPLCSQFVNCVIPVKYLAHNRRLNRICYNYIMFTLHKQYAIDDIQNLFLLLFKHLIESKVFMAQINIHLYEQGKKKRYKTQQFILQFITDMYHQSYQQIQQQFDESIENLLKLSIQTQKFIIGKIQSLFIKILLNKIKNNKFQINIDTLLDLSAKMREEEYLVVKVQIYDIDRNIHKQIEQRQETQAKNINNNLGQRQTVSKYYPARLPKNGRNLEQFGNFLCNICNQRKRQKMCLICGFIMCQMCGYSDQHRNQHEQKALQFIFNEAKVKFNMELSNQQSNFYFGSRDNTKELCLYYNQLMMPYREILDDVPVSKNENIELNEVLYYGLAEMLLN